MNFSAYSIKNPLVAIVLFVLLTLGGFIAFSKMSVQQFPDIDLPAVVVSVGMSGASPAQLENDVAKKIENKLANLEGIKQLRTSVQTGAVTVVGEFVLQKDINEALDDVRSAVSAVRGDLPAGATEPIVSKVSTSAFPVVSYSVGSDGLSDAQLSWWVDDVLNKRLSDIKGVGQISRVGGIERQIIVAADPSVLGGWRLPISHLASQVASLWHDASGGIAKVGTTNQTIRVVGAGDNLTELKNLPITTPMGAVALSTLAEVYDGHADLSSKAYLDDASVVAISISRARGASEVAMVDLIDEELGKLKNEYPHIDIQKIYDNAAPIKEDYKASIQMLIEGCLLAVVVVFVFLGNWRATIVTAAALPLSIIPTFLVIHWLGFSLNLISLLALSLVIGVLVDDAIVEVENIMRHLHMGKTPFEAAMEAADEIGLAVVATTFTLIAVFLPTAFMQGTVGQFFAQFGWTASIAVFISLLVARLITPMMAAYLLVPERPKVAKTGRLMSGYLAMTRWALRHRFLVLGCTLLFFVGSLMLTRYLPTAFMPNDDTNQSQVTFTLTPDATLNDTVRVGRQAARAIADVDGVSAVFLAAGSSGGGMGGDVGVGAVNDATLHIMLDERGQRPTKTVIEQTIREQLQTVAGARFRVGLSVGGGTGYAFSLVSGQSQLLESTAERIIAELSANAGLSISSDMPLPKPELSVTPQRLASAERGVGVPEMAQTLRVATLGDYAKALPKMNFDSRQLPIVVRLPDEYRGDMATLSRLYVPSNQINGVQLGDVATLSLGTGESEIRRFDRGRAIKITVEGDQPLGVLTELVKKSPSVANLPDGVRLVEEGDAQSMNELFSGFVLAMAVGVVCIFAVLILLFHRILQPLTILMALPLSVGGAFVGLLLVNGGLSMPSLIGFIMLMGIATKNSILLVDYAIVAQNGGSSPFDAIIEACQKRARPIIMTTIAMGAGMLPLVFGWGGADSSFRQPMAAAVLGGLITSTFLSLVVIPVAYTLMDDMGVFFKGKKRAI